MELLEYITLVLLPYLVIPLYVILILQRLWFWMKLYNPALKLIPGPRTTRALWARQYRPTIDLFPSGNRKPGVRLWRDFKGFVIFAGLFGRDKVLWFGSWTFHVAMLVLLIVHLKWLVPLVAWFGEDALRRMAQVAGWATIGSGMLLFVRRLLVARVRQITSKADYTSEIVLNLTVLTGLWVGYDRPDAHEVYSFLKGLVSFNPIVPDFGLSFVLHLLSFQLLLVLMPFSHLLHSGGIFVSRRFLASPNSFSGDV
ncbi:respiratory nitrate reductase subunit gamma [bacterium]|nr:respiratory nitrate reductase subunit gamma [bacterium]